MLLFPTRSSRFLLATSSTLCLLAASASVAYKYRLRPSKDRSFHEDLVAKKNADAVDSNVDPPRNKLEPDWFLEKWLLHLARLVAMGGSANFGAWLFTITGKRVESLSGKDLFDSLIASRPSPGENDRPSSLALRKPCTGTSTATTESSSDYREIAVHDSTIQPDWDENDVNYRLDDLPEDGESMWPGEAKEVPLITVCNHSSGIPCRQGAGPRSVRRGFTGGALHRSG